ncbi:S8 family peptidase [Neomicrococcus lactis]|uniref:S8 family peptidase n=1 Tax=Neomicrococcus lactis TaxID=732241 RepID=UPI0022FFE462|nr:S8 family serine peptidase [Neomicrococcus lactis]
MKKLASILVGVLVIPLAACSGAAESSTVDVAIVDTGVKRDVEAFRSYDIKQRNADPSSGHGTMVLSVILGVNDESLTPVPSDRVSVHSFDTGPDPTAADLAQAINDAVDQDVDLISISMGVRRSSEALEMAVNNAIRKEIPIVAAAGNVRFLAADYPARYDDTISVSTVDDSGNFWEGAPRQNVDAATPGVNVPVLTEKGSKQRETGTSISTAVVTRDILEQLITGKIRKAIDYKPSAPTEDAGKL